MLLLSNAHADAATEVQRNIFLAAGGARLSVYWSVFQVGYVLGYLAYIMIGIVIRKTSPFGKYIPNLAILTGIGGFGFYLPKIGALFSVLVIVFVGIWNVMVGLKLFRMKNT